MYHKDRDCLGLGLSIYHGQILLSYHYSIILDPCTFIGVKFKTEVAKSWFYLRTDISRIVSIPEVFTYTKVIRPAFSFLSCK